MKFNGVPSGTQRSVRCISLNFIRTSSILTAFYKTNKCNPQDQRSISLKSVLVSPDDAPLKLAS